MEDDEFPGVQCETFDEAANYVQNKLSDPEVRSKVDQNILLSFYGLYKRVTEGKCSPSSQPSILNLRNRAKWKAWMSVSDLDTETAIQKYVQAAIDHLGYVPFGAEISRDKGNPKKSSGLGNHVSRLVPASSEPEDEEETIFNWVKDNDLENVTNWLKAGNGNSVNVSDEEGRSLLHWAVDRGLVGMCKLLLQFKADPEQKDNEEESPKDYAMTCEYYEILDVLKNSTRPSVTS